MFDLPLVFIIQTLDVTQPEKSKICFVWCLFTQHFCCTNRFPDIVTDKCVAFVHTTPPPPPTIRIVFTPHQKIEMIMKYNKHIKKITMIKYFIFGQLFQKVENDENRFFAITSSKLVTNWFCKKHLLWNDICHNYCFLYVHQFSLILKKNLFLC